jgi:hypothetical protein
MKLNYLTLGFVVLLGFTSCSKDEETTPEPITKANITGSVNLYDEGTTKIDHSGMTITVEGTSPVISAITNADGNFTLIDVPFGTYTLLYEKTGYGTYKRFNVEHKDGITFIPDAPALGQKSTTTITNLTVGSNSNFPVILGATTDPVGSRADTRYIRYFFSTDSNISSDNYESVLETFPVNITPYNLNLSQASLDALGFPSGSTVYVRCYGESFWGNNYSDPNLGRDIFPNLNQNSATAVSFVMP